MKRGTLTLPVLLGLVPWFSAPSAVLAEPDCGDHSQAALRGGDEIASSPHIHRHREGVILPLGPTVSAVPLTSVSVEAEAAFFSCMVRNFIINVRAEFAIDMTASTADRPLPVAFPITTHALYGDHNQFRQIAVSVGATEIPYHVALDSSVWTVVNGEVWYKGRLINRQVHPLLQGAGDLRLVAPHLAAKGFDLVIYWWMPPPGGSVLNRVTVEYTTSSDDFSSCCREVSQCTYGRDPYYFYFDLSNAGCWPGPTTCRVLLRDSATAQWAGVPKTELHTVVTRDAIELTSDAAGVSRALPDLAIPAQPAVFDVWPRRWSDGSTVPPVRSFALSWIGRTAGAIDGALIDPIKATPGIAVQARLPIVLNDRNPTETFTAFVMPPIPALAYIDVFGTGTVGNTPHPLYEGWLRIPLAGDTLSGHDVAVRDLKVLPGSSSSDWTVRVTVANQGAFTEPLLVTILVNNRFVSTHGFRSLLPGDVVTLNLPIHWAWELPSDVEVEVEPAPGEVARMNNAATVTYPPPPRPRHAIFALRPDQSTVRFRLPCGCFIESKLLGDIRLYLGDPGVPVPEIAGLVGLSVERAALVAPDFDPATCSCDPLPEPLYMHQSPLVHSVGSWNYLTGEIQFELYLVTPDGELPAQQPTIFTGTLANTGLSIRGLSSDPTAIPRMMMDIFAHEVAAPPPLDLWFSTEVGFHASRLLTDPDGAIRRISAGDLLSRRGFVVRTNRELTARLGIMPVVPDLGLDAVARGPRGTIWFSFEEDNSPVWSETLGVWLKHGDLLSDAGFVVQTNERLLQRFVPMPVVADAGLDAIEVAPNGEYLFSTESDYFSAALGRHVKHGDLLSSRGYIVRTNERLLANFNPVDSSGRPVPRDYGLDAVILRANREVWFSTEESFQDANLGPISDGDLLSTNGYVVAENLRLLDAFGPIEDLANFGLDAATLVVRPSCRFDFDLDGDVDLVDFAHMASTFSGPNRPTVAAAPSAVSEFDADVDDDGDVDLADFTAFAVCFNGPNWPPACQ